MSSAKSVASYTEFYHDDQAELEEGQFAITFIGVSTLLFEDNESRFLIDAFFSRQPRLRTLLRSRTVPREAKKPIERFNLQEVEAVFVSHAHIDHALDVGLLASKGTKVYGTKSVHNIALGENVPEKYLEPIDSGKTHPVGAFRVTALESPHSPEHWLMTLGPPTIRKRLRQPASHWRFAGGQNHDFIIRYNQRAAVVKPSAGFIPGALAGIEADVLLLATARLGMQDPGFQHAYLEETIGTTKAKTVIPIHWDDFVTPWEVGAAQLMRPPMDKDSASSLALVRTYAMAHGAKFIMLQAGSRIVV